MSGMNVTEAQFEELRNNQQRVSMVPIIEIGDSVMRHLGARPPSGGSRKAKAEIVKPLAGPVDVTLVLHGHCPSKKNLWERGTAGKMFLPKEVTAQIDTLITQAMFGWKFIAPVDHPELTVKFFVHAQRRDRDGMFVTVLDVMQKAGILVNDNFAHLNARIVLEPAEFVGPSDERVEIRVVKK